MILYMDSSSVVKLFVLEKDSDDVRLWAASASSLVTSRVALVETASALARLGREKVLGSSAAVSLVEELLRQWAEFTAMDVNEHRAVGLAVKHGLRGFDAIHLAAVLDLRDSALPGAEVRFSSFDRRLNAAATAEGLVILQ